MNKILLLCVLMLAISGYTVYLPEVINDPLPPSVTVVFGTRDYLLIVGYINSACHKASLDVDVSENVVFVDVVSERTDPCPPIAFFSLYYDRSNLDGRIVFVNDQCVIPEIGCVFTR